MNENLVNPGKNESKSVGFQFKRLLMLMTAVMAALTLHACDEDNPDDETENPVEVTKVTVNQPSSGAELTVGVPVTLTVTIEPANADDKTVTWSSSSNDIATVSDAGVVTGVKAGTVTITATSTSGNKSGNITLTVKAAVVEVTKVTINPPSGGVELTAGGSPVTLTVTIEPSNATDKTVTWRSSNTDIATVSATGVVTPLKEGSVTITATSTSGNKSDNITLTVKANGSSGVEGKRLKTTVQTTGPIDGSYRSEYTYSDGTLNREDVYDESSKLLAYSIFTNNSDGTRNKMEFYDLSNSSEPQLAHVYTYSYDANKKPLQGKGIYYTNGTQYGTVTIDFTFQNGKKTGEKMTFVFGNAPYSETFTTTFAHNYDNNGRRTTTTETHSLLGARQYTRTYNSDGTLQKVTYPYGYGGSDNRTVTKEFTWENGKKTYDEDDFEYW